MERQYIIAFLSGLILTIIFSYSLIFNIDKIVSFYQPLHSDNYLFNFFINHYISILSDGNWSEIFNVPMFYGYKNSLFSTDHYLIQALFTLPFFITTKNIILSTNLVFILALLTSFLAMYLLTFHFTKDTLASILASVLFAFNTYVLAKFPFQIVLVTLAFIPLIFFYFEKMIRQPTIKNSILLFFFLSLQLLSSVYYFAFLTVILPIYILFRVLQIKPKLRSFFNWGTFSGLSLLGVLFFATFVSYSSFATERAGRGLSISYDFSSKPTDILFSVPHRNLLYGEFFEYPTNSENVIFLGFVPLILLIMSFFFLRVVKVRIILSTFLLLFFLSLILSLGPKTFIYKIVYYINPLFTYIFSPDRFAAFVFFFLALICAMTLVEIKKRFSMRIGRLFGLCLILLLVLEYSNKPLDFYQVIPEQRSFYSKLNKEQDINVILDLPIGNNILPGNPKARSITDDGHYLLYATIFHHKKLFNGYSGSFPEGYYDKALSLTFNFPTKQKLQSLKESGVDGIVLHKEEFNDANQFEVVKRSLISLKVPLIYSSENLALFNLTVAP